MVMLNLNNINRDFFVDRVVGKDCNLLFTSFLSNYQFFYPMLGYRGYQISHLHHLIKRSWTNIILWVSRVNIQQQRVQILLPILLQANIILLFHPGSSTRSINIIIVTGLVQSKPKTSRLAPLSLAHILFPSILISITTKVITWVSSAMTKDTNE